jgi:hypothetical protein
VRRVPGDSSVLSIRVTGQKTGGRVAGTPNKRTQQIDAFLEGVFDEAFKNPAFKQNLVDSIVDLSIDVKLFALIAAYRFGAPPKEHKHTGTLTLEQLVLGTVKDEDTDADDVPPGAAADHAV